MKYNIVNSTASFTFSATGTTFSNNVFNNFIPFGSIYIQKIKAYAAIVDSSGLWKDYLGLQITLSAANNFSITTPIPPAGGSSSSYNYYFLRYHNPEAFVNKSFPARTQYTINVTVNCNYAIGDQVAINCSVFWK